MGTRTKVTVMHRLRPPVIACSAFAAVSCAAAADVTVYGVVDLGAACIVRESLDASTTHTFEETSGFSSGSRFGFKALEDLAPGYQVSVRLENGFAADAGTLNQGGRLFGREALVSLSTPFGTLSAGRAGVLTSGSGSLEVFASRTDALPGGWSGIFNIGNFAHQSMRVDNLLHYSTAAANGLALHLQYAFGNDVLAGDDDGLPNERSRSRYAGAAITYDNGPVSLALVFDSTLYKHKKGDASGASDGRVVSFGGSWNLSAFKLFAAGQIVRHQRAAYNGEALFRDRRGGVMDDADGFNAHLGVSFRAAAGDVQLAAYHGRLKQNKDAAAKTRHWNLVAAYTHPLSKQTALYAGVAWKSVVMDGGSAKELNNRTTQMAAGLRHRF